jgi:UDP-N-acetylglucosamine 2-epimerase
VRTLRIITVVGARPQFVKAAAVSRAIALHNQNGLGAPIDERIVHTGQHYDDNMSRAFFDELDIPRPMVNLEVGSGRHGRQTGLMLERIEDILLEQKPDWVLVYGDTNSTLAGALAAAKLHLPVAHVEAGLRSYNRQMPEEINRLVADSLSSLLFCPSETARRNLAREGITRGVHVVGDVMYDSLLFHRSLAERKSDVLARLGLEPKQYYLATVHRAENTDEPARLAGVIEALCSLSLPVVLPLHPRTRKTLGPALADLNGNVRAIEPVPYLDMLMLERSARVVLTDSGGVQKEAYWLGVPCVTLRDETEWVELVETGWNRIAGVHGESIVTAVAHLESCPGPARISSGPGLFGDGRAAARILFILGERAERPRGPQNAGQ